MDRIQRKTRSLFWIQFTQWQTQTTITNSKRFRYKQKWATHEKRLTNCQQALGHFDAFYKPVYGHNWPSIRLSLLSLPKHCAAVNIYGNYIKEEEKLLDLGTLDLLKTAALFSDSLSISSTSADDPENNSQTEETKQSLNLQNYDNDGELSKHNSLLEEETYQDEQFSGDDLNVFVPTEKVYSERDQLLREEISVNAFKPRDISLEILPAEKLNFPQDLRAFVFPSGVVSRFPPPRPHNGVLGYYLMDAASILPVLALDVQPTDSVLDLCAAPGGKSFLILQLLRFHEGGSLHCNDSAYARICRLRDVLQLNFPRDIAQHITVTKMDGTTKFPTAYNKVLVDVPCNSDRHVVTEDENNLFKISRTRERLDLVDLQKDLLISAIRSCVPGGSIVYSTCTLSPAQNDGVIQAAAEELWETSEMEFAVQDLSNLQHALSHTFKFHDRTKYGLTVLPTLLNNFGPSFVAKLRRVK